jgi:hypothetical protein
MTPYEYLEQQATNVEQALSETLRYEYGPKRTLDYYQECSERLDRIKFAITATSKIDYLAIQARLDELTSLSVWISLIERSRLGEFSWPFAEALRKMAEELLADTGLSGVKMEPIVHVVADGEGYFIHYETTSPSGKHKFAFIAFPRPLKHHVLLHSLFGHELGHTALHTVTAGNILQNEVLTALQADGPLQNPSEVTAWLSSAAAPIQVKDELNRYLKGTGRAFVFIEPFRLQWLDEFICDLFGLLLFGPGFAAAHQAYLRPLSSNPYEIGLLDSSHPPYAVRHRVLVRAMQLLGWHNPISTKQPCQDAEDALLTYILADTYDPWSTVLTDKQLTDAIAGIEKVFAAYPNLGYVKPDSDTVIDLVSQLSMRLPPIIARLSNRGVPDLRAIDISQMLYAGWIYTIGFDKLGLEGEPLTFLQTNMLCDRALLQQGAINIARAKRMQ